MAEISIDSQRLWKSLMDLPGRRHGKKWRAPAALSSWTVKRANLFVRWCKDAGCSVAIDGIGNSSPGVPARTTVFANHHRSHIEHATFGAAKLPMPSIANAAACVLAPANEKVARSPSSFGKSQRRTPPFSVRRSWQRSIRDFHNRCESIDISAIPEHLVRTALCDCEERRKMRKFPYFSG